MAYPTGELSAARIPKKVAALPLARRSAAQEINRISRGVAAAMGKLARLVDGIKARLSRKEEEEAAAACYDKVDKTDSMRVELRSRRAQELIAKNLAAVDSLGRRGVGGKKNKKRFFAF